MDSIKIDWYACASCSHSSTQHFGISYSLLRKLFGKCGNMKFSHPRWSLGWGEWVILIPFVPLYNTFWIKCIYRAVVIVGKTKQTDTIFLTNKIMVKVGLSWTFRQLDTIIVERHYVRGRSLMVSHYFMYFPNPSSRKKSHFWPSHFLEPSHHLPHDVIYGNFRFFICNPADLVYLFMSLTRT